MSRTKTRLIAACLGLALAGLAAVQTPVRAGQRDIKLVQVAWGLDDIFFQTVQDGVKYKAEELAKAGGYKFERTLRGSGNPGQQVTMLESLLALSPNFMVFCTVDSNLTGPVRQYNARNIPVICNNVTIYGGKHTFVAFDNVIAGETCGKTLLKLLHDRYGPTVDDLIKAGGVIVQLTGDLKMSAAQERRKGFENIINPILAANPGLKLVTEEVKWNADLAYKAMTSFHTQYGNKIIGVYTHDDTSAIGGVWPAMAASGRGFLSDQPGHVVTVCIDGTTAALQMVREKKLDAITVQPAWGEGEVVAMLIDAINKQGDSAIAKVGDLLWANETRPFIMDLIPDQFTAEEHAKGAKPVWAPVEVVEGKTAFGSWDGVWYKTNSTSVVPLDYPADSKLLWGNFWGYLKDGKWPWDK
ncbi:MAG: sugar ABC transporter substrate-binding protein [Planctomycetota bacterium]|nr:sugar ABC transporter substrate-binding protein [Planctomycetota bacterium]